MKRSIGLRTGLVALAAAALVVGCAGASEEEEQASTGEASAKISQIGGVESQNCSALARFSIESSMGVDYVAIDAADWSGDRVDIDLLEVDEAGARSELATRAVSLATVRRYLEIRRNRDASSRLESGSESSLDRELDTNDSTVYTESNSASDAESSVHTSSLSESESAANTYEKTTRDHEAGSTSEDVDSSDLDSGSDSASDNELDSDSVNSSSSESSVSSSSDLFDDSFDFDDDFDSDLSSDRTSVDVDEDIDRAQDSRNSISTRASNNNRQNQFSNSDVVSLSDDSEFSHDMNEVITERFASDSSFEDDLVEMSESSTDHTDSLVDSHSSSESLRESDSEFMNSLDEETISELEANIDELESLDESLRDSNEWSEEQLASTYVLASLRDVRSERMELQVRYDGNEAENQIRISTGFLDQVMADESFGVRFEACDVSDVDLE